MKKVARLDKIGQLRRVQRRRPIGRTAIQKPEKRLISLTRPKTICGIIARLQCRKALCLAVLALCLCKSDAQAQEKSAADRIASKLGHNHSSSAEAKSSGLDVRQSFSAAGTRGSSSLARAEDAAIGIISSVLELSDVDSFSEQPAAGLKLSHTTAAMNFKLPLMKESRLNFIANVGLGATRLRSFELGEVPSDRTHRFSEQFLSLQGGLTVSYSISKASSAFVGVRHQYYIDDADGLAMDEAPNPGKLLDASSWTFPLTVGFRIALD